MQGIKTYQEKLFVSFQLSERVPPDNFYRRLKETIDFSYLRKLTKPYYGTEGQKSIDTAVFFKLMLIGYLENINSDRKIIEQASMRMDMLYFLGYDIDEPLPWHSTLSRTRKLLGEEVFLEVFRNILNKCAEKGMVSGRTQSVDSAFIRANASMDSLVERELHEKSRQFFNAVTAGEDENPSSKLKYSEQYVSTTDPDARVSQKRGKLPALNHLGIISVDTAHHVICGAMAEFADIKDSKTTEDIVGQTLENLHQTGLEVEEVLADTNYSSGESYAFLEDNSITAYIPPHGAYNPEREGFVYNEQEDCYTCSQGVKLCFKGIKKEKSRTTLTKRYRSTVADCKNCPLRETCCKKMKYKQIEHTADKAHYDRAYQLINPRRGKRMRRLRQSTVEPVWGTLLYFRGLKKVYTKGNDLANKQVLLASTAYNLKKYMAFKGIKSAASVVKYVAADLKSKTFEHFLMLYKLLGFALRNYTLRKQMMTVYR